MWWPGFLIPVVWKGEIVEKRECVGVERDGGQKEARESGQRVCVCAL